MFDFNPLSHLNDFVKYLTSTEMQKRESLFDHQKEKLVVGQKTQILKYEKEKNRKKREKESGSTIICCRQQQQRQRKRKKDPRGQSLRPPDVHALHEGRTQVFGFEQFQKEFFNSFLFPNSELILQL